MTASSVTKPVEEDQRHARFSTEGLEVAVKMLFDRFCIEEGYSRSCARNIRVSACSDGQVRVMRNFSYRAHSFSFHEHAPDADKERGAFLIKLLGNDGLDRAGIPAVNETEPRSPSSATVSPEELETAIDKLATQYGMRDSVAARINRLASISR